MCVCVSIHIGEYFHHRSDQRGWKAGRGKVGVYHVLNMFGDRLAVGRSLECGGERLLAYNFITFFGCCIHHLLHVVKGLCQVDFEGHCEVHGEDVFAPCRWRDELVGGS